MRRIHGDRLDARAGLAILGVLAGCSAASAAGPETWRQAGRAEIERARALTQTQRARNVILFVGDGMGVSTVTAARILDGQLRGEPGEENLLSFERLPYVALSKTYNTNQQVADSAGTMTAMVTGVKTRAGVISVDESVPRGDHTRAAAGSLRTLIEEAEARGLATGVVTTTRITHATPAACYAHSPERDWESDADLPEAAREDGFADIARQLIEFPHGDGLEVALGGGRRAFLPRGVSDPENPEQHGVREDGRDLTAEWRAREGAAYVWNAEQLARLERSRTRALLGLFEASHMQWEAHRAHDRGGEPSLAEMTNAALDIVERDPEGFVLMVEAGRIDHGHHAGSAYLALHDTVAYSDAVAAALSRVDLSETLVIVTADHDHTLTMAGYAQRGNPIFGLSIYPDSRGDPSDEPMKDGLGLPYTTLGYLNGPGYAGASSDQPEGPKRFPHMPKRFDTAPHTRPDLTDHDTTRPDYLPESAIPMRAETHAGHDVPIYAGGPGAHLFHGVHEQSYVYHVAVEALGWAHADAPPVPPDSWLDRLLGR
jgi:alkaline phosphatase